MCTGFVRTTILGVWFLGCASLGFAQWQFGGAAGYGFYRNGAIVAPAGTATAGIRDRFAASAVLTDEMYEHIGGEIRYTYQDGDPFLKQGATRFNLQGQSHAVHYDLLVHSRPREAAVRPYLAVGMGAKYYRVSGPPNPVQPFRPIGILAARNQTVFLFTAGAGVSVRVQDHVFLRFDFRDYMTPFPDRMLVPSRLATGRGILHMFTPLVGISYGF